MQTLSISNVERIPRQKYMSSNYETIIISDGVTEIGDEAFRYCSNLKTVVLPESLVEIGECAFANCPNLQNVECKNELIHISNMYVYPEGIPEGITVIGEYTFHESGVMSSV